MDLTNGMTTYGGAFMLAFTAAPTATSLQFHYQVSTAVGPFTVSDLSLEGEIPSYTITRKTYFLGSQAIATRISGDPDEDNNGPYYFHTDHLGSTSLMSDAAGQKVETSVARYLPYGGWRTEPTANLTDRAYTGQKHNMDIGLYYYNARYYAPGTGRFISADTLVPDPTNPQQFNRYTYVLGNPLRYTDPTGHCISSYDPNEQYDELQYCVGSVLVLNKYFYDTYGKDWADNMHSYIVWLLENAPIEQVLLDLAAWGIDPPPNNPLAPQSGSLL